MIIYHLSTIILSSFNSQGLIYYLKLKSISLTLLINLMTSLSFMTLMILFFVIKFNLHISINQFIFVFVHFINFIH